MARSRYGRLAVLGTVFVAGGLVPLARVAAGGGMLFFNDADGAPGIEFLDKRGKAVKRITG